jgi:hypothetical protein
MHSVNYITNNSLGDTLDLPKYRKKIGFVRFYALAIVGIGFAFYAGHQFAKLKESNLHAQNRLLNKSLSNLTGVHEELQSRYNVLKVELDIAKIANDRSQELINERINQEQALKEKVTFYQRVMAPEMTQDGFLLQRMEVSPTLSDRNYSIKMIFLQHEDVKSVIKGTLEMRLFGSADGKPTSVNITSVQDKPETPLNFAFKYFQVLETSITLPEGFSPERFEISTAVYKYKRKRGDYSTVIKWSEAFVDDE